MLVPNLKMASNPLFRRPKPFCPTAVDALVMAVLPFTVYTPPLNLVYSLSTNLIKNILAIYVR